MIGWGIYQSVYGSNSKFPPVASQCPDYWSMETKTSNGNPNTYCENKLKIGIGTPGTCKTFDTTDYSDQCAQWALANKCKITWDGISNNDSVQSKCSNIQSQN